jgi:hypothetical protein
MIFEQITTGGCQSYLVGGEDTGGTKAWHEAGCTMHSGSEP